MFLVLNWQIKRLRTSVYQSLCGCMLSFLLGKYLEVEGLGHTLDMFHFIRNCHAVLQRGWSTCYRPLADFESRSASLPILDTISLFNFSCSSGVWCSLTMVLICISLRTSDVEHLSMCVFCRLYHFFGEVFV